MLSIGPEKHRGRFVPPSVIRRRREAKPAPCRSKDQRKAFVRELDAMTRLRSPHTVNVYGAVTSLSDRLILVMELLPGGDLGTFIKRSTKLLPPPEAHCIIEDICAGMAFLHSKSTIHGDLKPANVLLDGTGRVKVRPRRWPRVRGSGYAPLEMPRNSRSSIRSAASRRDG